MHDDKDDRSRRGHQCGPAASDPAAGAAARELTDDEVAELTMFALMHAALMARKMARNAHAAGDRLEAELFTEWAEKYDAALMRHRELGL